MPLQKDWLLLLVKEFSKNHMSSETESIVKYLFWDSYVLFPAQSLPADFFKNPFKCLKLVGKCPAPPTLTFFFF